MKSYKTTLAGIAAILTAGAGVLTALGSDAGLASVDWPSVTAAVISGVGLILARDNSVTSEKAGAK